MAGRRDQPRLSSDRELGFERHQCALRFQEVSALFGIGIVAVAFRDVRRNRHRAVHDVVGEGLDLAPRALSHCANDLAAEHHRFLPYLEVPHPGSHGAEGAYLGGERPHH